MSLHEFLQRDPACSALLEGALAATAPLLEDDDPAPIQAQLEAWALELAGRMPLPWNFHGALDQLNQFLFQELGFQGDRKTYDDPRNALIPQVLERRRGLPITLSILWIELARKLGFEAVGIGLPGHFLCAVRHDLGHLCFDPFHGGLPVGPERAEHLVTLATQGQTAFHPRHLDPIPDRALLARLVRNLHARFLQQEAWTEILWTSTHLILLDPSDPAPWKARAMVHLRNGDARAAESDLQEAAARSAHRTP